MDTMKKNLGKKWTAVIALLSVFVLFTAAIRFVDVEKAGPEASEIGFARLNTAFADRIGYHPSLYTAAEILGYLAILLCAFFGAVGLWQLIRRRSLLKVDARILALGCLYVSVVLIYVLFEVLKVNYRPILMDGTLEASYPSSHTMLGVCVFGSAIPVTGSFMNGKGKKIPGRIFCTTLALLAALTVLTRLLSGVHWLTDIVGSLLLSAALMEFFSAVLIIFLCKQNMKHTENQQ